MFAPEFDYHKASSVAEAIELLSANAGAKLIAGGQSLIPLPCRNKRHTLYQVVKG